ncbi:uncharacterized protein LTR77_000962 [Saxophila tyrrhenica]|uniref:Uncharacterized protein n=1 Tax=Saxophila tyrrhenica TaxID=1690608 RepID=A0AAV9PSC6_9PEZI|nr:hypothetical protein LTR77_000962 [Saxophila tyrrhenica]
MADPFQDAPEIPVLLLGDPGVDHITHVSSSRLTLGLHPNTPTRTPLPTLRDLDQPFPFHIRLYNRPYRFEFSDTASPTNYTLLRPALIILCYSIAIPSSLANIQKYWKEVVERHFNYDESLPVILLGLGRDVRQKEDYGGRVKRLADEGEGEETGLVGRGFVYPQEGLRVAQEMRCDVYCECSALTGEVS